MASPQTTPLGFGIVGIGLIADFHAQAIAGLVQYTFQTYADPS